MANEIHIGDLYYVLAEEDYQFMKEVYPVGVADFFSIDAIPGLYFAWSQDIDGSEHSGLVTYLGSLSIGEAYFTTSVQANIFFNG